MPGRCQPKSQGNTNYERDSRLFTPSTYAGATRQARLEWALVFSR